MRKDHIIRLINLASLFESKHTQFREFLKSEYWLQIPDDCISSLLMDVLGIPVGYVRDDFFDLYKVFEGNMTHEEFLLKAEGVTDPTFKPSYDEVIQRLTNISRNIQSLDEQLDQLFHTDINFMRVVVDGIDEVVEELIQKV